MQAHRHRAQAFAPPRAAEKRAPIARGPRCNEATRAAPKSSPLSRVPARGPLWLLPPGPDQVRDVTSPDPVEKARR